MTDTAPLPISVVIVTRNEAAKIKSCLSALHDFGEVIVVDSMSTDETLRIAESCGAKTVSFSWNGDYPKKRQWCLDTLPLRYDFVFWVDADEIVPPSVVTELRTLFSTAPPDDIAGIFITARYKIDGVLLRHGIPNRKIALFHRKKMMFPVVDDIGLPGMGEIEGHYQPVRTGAGGRIFSLKAEMIHEAFDDEPRWVKRHEGYAAWEAGMNERNAWPVDPVPEREIAKRFLRRSGFRAEFVFLYGYFFKGGFLDGREGFCFALRRYRYHKMIATASTVDKSSAVACEAPTEARARIE